MLQKDQQDKAARRLAGEARSPQAKVPTYQELLDEALDDTFPASDPVAASAAMHAHEPHTTTRDAKDWTLKPGACSPVGVYVEEDDHVAALAAPCDCHITECFVCPTGHGRVVTVPPGPCTVQQSEGHAVLTWMLSGTPHMAGIPVEQYRQMLARGFLQRAELC